MAAEFAIGIDLGTTNCVVAFSPLHAEVADVKLLRIPQLVAPGTIESQEVLPSALYLPPRHELTEGAFDLPGKAGREYAVGRFALGQAAEVPQRTVCAAKSWLVNHRVDRHASILPWNAPDDVPKLSPVLASQRYLEHLVDAWHGAFPDRPILEQDVVVTVPASFDPDARELTRQAAVNAGLPERFVLLEEPQAAVYAWLDSASDSWRKTLSVGDCLLVCDIGGGTTDLTVISVSEHHGELALERLAVGSHLLVGGDNMDVALAHHAAGLFQKQGTKLDPWQSVSLWHACRVAKERLMQDDGPDTHTVSVLGRGSKLIGGTVSVELDRKQAIKLLADGFFPKCSADERPDKQRQSGFREIGLEYETDTSITRHLASFLSDHGNGGPLRPSHVLLNGGVFKSALLRQRLVDVLQGWTGKEKLDRLHEAADLEQAVARGAAYYAWSKRNGGVRIRGGTARSYYVGIETAGLAIPGAPRPLRALCVVPKGMEEGTEADVPSADFGLVVGELSRFRFFSSTIRKNDKPGDSLGTWPEDELQETASLETELAADEQIDEPYVPVRFHARITELGVLELWCVSTKTDKRWKLEFSVRERSDE